MFSFDVVIMCLSMGLGPTRPPAACWDMIRQSKGKTTDILTDQMSTHIVLGSKLSLLFFKKMANEDKFFSGNIFVPSRQQIFT